mgnify:CR=1 FL=1
MFLSTFDTTGSRSTRNCEVPAALFWAEPFSAALPLSALDGSYIFVMTGFTAAGAAGAGVGAITAGAGGAGVDPPKHAVHHAT